jgi:hypothetical protein
MTLQPPARSLVALAFRPDKPIDPELPPVLAEVWWVRLRQKLAAFVEKSTAFEARRVLADTTASKSGTLEREEWPSG